MQVCPECGTPYFKVIENEDLIIGAVSESDFEKYGFICENGHLF